MKADLSQDMPEEVKDAVKALLTELGNPGHAIPFYAFYPAGRGEPVVIGNSPILQGQLIERLEAALVPADTASISVGP